MVIELCEGCKHNRRIGRMGAGKGISLDSDVVKRLPGLGRSYTSYLLMDHIRSFPEEDILKERTYDCRKDEHLCDLLSSLLIYAPVKEAHQGDNYYGLREQRKENSNIFTCGSEVRLEPLHKGGFKPDKKRISTHTEDYITDFVGFFVEVLYATIK